MKQAKILFVLDKLNVGGTERVNFIIANALNQQVYVSTFGRLVAPFETTAEVLYLNELSLLQKLVYGFRHVFKKLINQPTNLVDLPAKTDQLIEVIKKKEIEVIILNSQFLLMTETIKKACPDVKVINWIHFDKAHFQERHWISDQVLEEQLAFCDCVVALTETTRQALLPLQPNTVCIPNPLTIETGGQVSTLEKQVISFVGRLETYMKGIDYLVEIATHLPEDWQLAVAGPASKKELNTFHQLIKQHHAEEKIIYQGTLNSEALKRHYLNSSIFVVTSRFEGFPLVTAEAMAFGLPVVAFDVEGPRDVLNFGEFGQLIALGNVDEMLAKL
ncbi:MAG: glycosyltransferase, partial [Streptococcaceae bacterium]|nr:glycosyltransferase [Streptococcaceae bacterium]